MGGILSQISLLNSEADQRGIIEKCKRQVKDIWYRGFLFRFAVTGIPAYKENSDLKNTEDGRKNKALITMKGIILCHSVHHKKRGILPLISIKPKFKPKAV